MSDFHKAGDRVYFLLVNDETGEEKKRWGTVERDEDHIWEFTDVRFDDAPGFVQPILCYYLFDEEEVK